MKTKTIYHLNHACDKVVRIEVIEKSKKNKKRSVHKTKRKENRVMLTPEKTCEIYNDIANTLGWRLVDPSHKIFNS